VTGGEEENVLAVLRRGKFSGDGPFSQACNTFLTEHFGVERALVTPSGTDALEMAAMLCDLEPGDEVIAPSYGFSSTANAFVRCGAKMVFVDVLADTMNIDPQAVADAVTERTRAVVALHYAGVPCDMQAISTIARRHDLRVVEDAAQAVFSTYEGRPCGTLGDFGCFSFHETKNLQCGEGGALLVNGVGDVSRAEILWEKGTDRTRFFRGEVDKYTWCDIGSSFVLSELSAAFLLAQLHDGHAITDDRLRGWNDYRIALEPLVEDGLLAAPRLSMVRGHNGHIFWIKVKDLEERSRILSHLDARGVHAVFHYVPLHTAPAGLRYGKFRGSDVVTTRDSERLVRLPLFYKFEDTQVVVAAIESFYR
jgi:dTDP-4-amino-4,6-dideoxygalactose transaminase